MQKIRIFTGPSPVDVETQLNEWLQTAASEAKVIQMAPTDAVHVAHDGGLQRYSMAVLYESRKTPAAR